MPASSKKPIPLVINLDHDRLTLCDNKTSAVLSFPYPAGVLSDMEVVNHDLLVSHLTAFISQHHLTPSHVVFVLSPNIYFEKDVSKLSDTEKQKQVEEFLDMIPFGSVSSKHFQLGGESKVVAINRDFYDSFKKTFEAMSFPVIAVVPSFVLGSMGLKGTFNAEACHLILRRMDYVLDNSFLTPEPETEGLGHQRQVIKKHPGLVVLVFILVISLTGLTAFMTLRRPQQAKVTVPRVAPPVSTPVPTTQPTPTPEATPSAQLSVQILNGSGVPGLASEVEAELTSLGFIDITLGNAPATPATLVIYSPRVSSAIKDRVGESLQKFFTALSSQESPDASFDVIITAGSPKATPIQNQITP